MDQSLSEVAAHEDIQNWVEAAVEERQGAHQDPQEDNDVVLIFKQYLFEPDSAQKNNYLKGEPTKEEGNHDSSEDP